MGIKGLFLMTAAGAGAYLLVKASRAQGSEAKVIYVATEPEPRQNKGALALSILDFAAGIIDGEAGTPIFGSGGLASDIKNLGSGIVNSVTGLTGGGSAIGGRLMGDLMRDFGFQRFQAAGVVGNLDHESAGFASLQEIAPVVSGSRGGYGYAQWTGPRRRDFEAWAAARGLSLNSYEANYGFLRHEMTATSERKVVQRLLATRTLEEATRVFSETFLRPGIVHMSSRLSRAQKYA